MNDIGSRITITPRIAIFSLHLAIFLVLFFGYEYFIVPKFGYEGYFFEPNNVNIFISLILMMILSLSTPIESGKPSTLFLHITLILVLIPMLVLFCAENKPWAYTFQSVAAYLVIILLLPLIQAKYIKLPSFDYNILATVLISFTVFYIAFIFAMGGWSYFNLDISKVYDFRTEAEENLGGIFGYISPLIGKVILPFSLLLSLITKRYFSVLLCILLSVIIFGLTAHKGPLFYPLFIVVIYFLLSNKNVIRNLSLVCIAVLAVSIVDILLSNIFDYYLFGWFGSLAMRRMFIVPGSINYMYYDFFSNNDFVFWSESKLTLGLLDYPYSIDTSHLIGLEYFGMYDAGANTGWLGSGYMHAGFISTLFYAFIISVVFSYIDKLATRVHDRRLVVAGIFLPIITLITSSDLPTAFLTHGLFMNLILIGFLKRLD